MPIAVIAPLNNTTQPLATEQTLTFFTQAYSEGVLWGLNVTAQGVPDLTVNVSRGFGICNSDDDLKKFPFASEGGTLSFGSAPSAGNSRIDLVVMAITSANGNLTEASIDVIAGTPATTGTQVAPILVEAANLFYIVLARVTITGASSAITSGQIVTTGSITNASNVNLQPITGATIFEIRPISTIENTYIEDGRFVEKTGDIMTGKLQFSGTNHAGVRLNNLTTVQRDALTPQVGDQIYNTDTGVVETRTALGWTGALAQKQINATKIFVEQNFI
jgi:hypothetical protein